MQGSKKGPYGDPSSLKETVPLETVKSPLDTVERK